MSALWWTCHINIRQRKLINPYWFVVHGRVLVATVMRAFKVYCRLSKNNFSGWSPALKDILFFWLALIAFASEAQLSTLHFPKPLATSHHYLYPFPFSYFYGDFCAPESTLKHASSLFPVPFWLFENRCTRGQTCLIGRAFQKKPVSMPTTFPLYCATLW